MYVCIDSAVLVIYGERDKVIKSIGSGLRLAGSNPTSAMNEPNCQWGLDLGLNPGFAVCQMCNLGNLLSFSKPQFSHLYMQNPSWKALQIVPVHRKCS